MEKLIYKHQNFIRTLSALERSIKIFLRTDIDEEIRETLVASLVKHFEMCYEASWKFLKYYLEIRYSQIANSPREVFRQCFIAGLLDEQTIKGLLKICDARNTMTHTYDEEKAQEICKRIDSYYQIFQKISCISLEM
jgi:nucleotidyltransferase substrate binding protein (TIGR01987 family)